MRHQPASTQSSLLELSLELYSAQTHTQAKHTFTRACIVLKDQAALLLFPLVKVLEANSYDEKALASVLTESLENLLKWADDSRTIQILDELAYYDEDEGVLSRFAKQMAFEKVCISGEMYLLNQMLKQDEGLMVTG